MDKKFLIIIVILTLGIFGGAIAFTGSSSSSNSSSSATKGVSLEKTVGAKIQILEEDFDFKDVKYSGGKVNHGYKIKNTGTKDLTVGNLSTSCMCTEVYLKTKAEEGPKYGMKGHGGVSGDPNWLGVVKPNEEAELIVIFDPQAHGPEGIGPVQRFASFETNDPDKPYGELAFKGVVIK